MNNQDFLKTLRLSGEFDLEVSNETDERIINNIYNPPIDVSWLDKLLKSFIIRPVLAVLVIGIFTFLVFNVNNNRKKIDSNELYNTVVSQIQQINADRDVERAVEIYDSEFFKQNNKAQLKQNIKTLFKSYSDIRYEPKNEKVIINGDKALIENQIKYFAAAKNKKTRSLHYQGRERIYLKRKHNNWKIVAWVYEEK